MGEFELELKVLNYLAYKDGISNKHYVFCKAIIVDRDDNDRASIIFSAYGSTNAVKAQGVNFEQYDSYHNKLKEKLAKGYLEQSVPPLPTSLMESIRDECLVHGLMARSRRTPTAYTVDIQDYEIPGIELVFNIRLQKEPPMNNEKIFKNLAFYIRQIKTDNKVNTLAEDIITAGKDGAEAILKTADKNLLLALEDEVIVNECTMVASDPESFSGEIKHILDVIDYKDMITEKDAIFLQQIKNSVRYSLLQVKYLKAIFKKINRHITLHSILDLS